MQDQEQGLSRLIRLRQDEKNDFYNLFTFLNLNSELMFRL